MGRQKIVIKKQELRAQRRTSFNKRSFSVKKKAMELSVLSDAKVMLLLQSPEGEYDLFLGQNSTFDDIVQQFLSERQEKRNKSWKSSMEVLEKAFRGDVQSSKVLMDHRMSHTEKKASQERELASIKEDISKLESQLGPLRNINEIDKIDNIDDLKAAKNFILEILVKNEREKELFIKQRRSGFHNFTISNTRDLKCFTSTEIPAPTNPYVPAPTDPYLPAPTDPYLPAPTNPYLPASTSPYIPMPTDPYVPAPTDPYVHAMNQQGILMSNSTALYQGGEAMCSTSKAGSWSNILHQRVDQEQVLMPNMYQFSEREYQEKISEIERNIAADPTGFFDFPS